MPREAEWVRGTWRVGCGVFVCLALSFIPAWSYALSPAMRRMDEYDLFYLKPVGHPEARFLYLNGKRSTIPGIKASQHSLIYNNEGIEPEEGLNGYLDVEVEGRAGPLFLYLKPLLSAAGGTRAVLHQGYLRLEVKGLDLEVGKESLWWGPGHHGGLLLTNNAEPLTMVRVTNPHPVLLPWVFGYLGPFRVDAFASRLERDRDVPEPYFTGMRVNFTPHPLVELGLTRTIIMGGEGRPGMNLKRFWDILFGEHILADGQDLSDSLSGVDLRLILPKIQVYGEVGGEDLEGGLPARPAHLVGLYLPDLGRGLDFRVEYADIHHKAWYRHGVYTSGYTYQGRLLGHHLGGGGGDLFLEVGMMKGRRLNGTINFDYEERGLFTQPVAERHYQVGTEWRYRYETAGLNWTIRTRVGYERVTDAGYTAGVEHHNGLASLGIMAEL